MPREPTGIYKFEPQFWRVTKKIGDKQIQNNFNDLHFRNHSLRCRSTGVLLSLNRYNIVNYVQF